MAGGNSKLKWRAGGEQHGFSASLAWIFPEILLLGTSLVALTTLSESIFNGFLHPVPLLGAITLIFSTVRTEELKFNSLEPGSRSQG